MQYIRQIGRSIYQFENYNVLANKRTKGTWSNAPLWIFCINTVDLVVVAFKSGVRTCMLQRDR